LLLFEKLNNTKVMATQAGWRATFGWKEGKRNGAKEALRSGRYRLSPRTAILGSLFDVNISFDGVSGSRNPGEPGQPPSGGENGWAGN